MKKFNNFTKKFNKDIIVKTIIVILFIIVLFLLFKVVFQNKCRYNVESFAVQTTPMPIVKGIQYGDIHPDPTLQFLRSYVFMNDAYNDKYNNYELKGLTDNRPLFKDGNNYVDANRNTISLSDFELDSGVPISVINEGSHGYYNFLTTPGNTITISNKSYSLARLEEQYTVERLSGTTEAMIHTYPSPGQYPSPDEESSITNYNLINDYKGFTIKNGDNIVWNGENFVNNNNEKYRYIKNNDGTFNILKNEEPYVAIRSDGFMIHYINNTDNYYAGIGDKINDTRYDYPTIIPFESFVGSNRENFFGGGIGPKITSKPTPTSQLTQINKNSSEYKNFINEYYIINEYLKKYYYLYTNGKQSGSSIAKKISIIYDTYLKSKYNITGTGNFNYIDVAYKKFDKKETPINNNASLLTSYNGFTIKTKNNNVVVFDGKNIPPNTNIKLKKEIQIERIKSLKFTIKDMLNSK